LNREISHGTVAVVHLPVKSAQGGLNAE
jgi:hypothetical protein